jgi:hypothetical protein
VEGRGLRMGVLSTGPWSRLRSTSGRKTAQRGQRFTARPLEFQPVCSATPGSPTHGPGSRFAARGPQSPHLLLSGRRWSLTPPSVLA